MPCSAAQGPTWKGVASPILIKKNKELDKWLWCREADPADKFQDGGRSMDRTGVDDLQQCKHDLLSAEGASLFPNRQLEHSQSVSLRASPSTTNEHTHTHSRQKAHVQVWNNDNTRPKRHLPKHTLQNRGLLSRILFRTGWKIRGYRTAKDRQRRHRGSLFRPLTLQRGVTGTALMLHALTHSSISRQVREQT